MLDEYEEPYNCYTTCECDDIGSDLCIVNWYICYLVQWTFRINEDNATGRTYGDSAQEDCTWCSSARVGLWRSLCV